MIQTVEAVIDKQGRISVKEKIKTGKVRRALLTILDDEIETKNDSMVGSIEIIDDDLESGSREITELFNWCEWQPMPMPENCRQISGPENSGLYQIRNKQSNKLILFGIGKKCQERMKSLYPKPFGTGTRNNEAKRKYILENWEVLEYRTMKTDTREKAKKIEDAVKAKKNHLFNT